MPTKSTAMRDLVRNVFRVFLAFLEEINEVLEEREKQAERGPLETQREEKQIASIRRALSVFQNHGLL